MQSLKQKGTGVVAFNAPINWDESRDGRCNVLMVRKQPHGERNTEFVSLWEPTQAELNMLNAGYVVELSIIGFQPPVALNVVPPPRED